MKMLKDAELWYNESSKAVERIHAECGICKQYSDTPSNPVVSMMSTSERGRIIAIDLKKLQDYN